MKKWENFASLIMGLSLVDAIDCFFEYTQSIQADRDTFLEGVDYLTRNGRPIMAVLISMEMILATMPEECYAMGDLDPVIIAYAKMNDLMHSTQYESADQVLEYLSEFRDEYPRAFVILDEKAGNA